MRLLRRRAALGLAAGSAALAAGLPRLMAAPAKPLPDLAHAPLFTDPAEPVLGNPQGIVPIAEFFDYRCPYCRVMHPRIQRLLAEQQDIRFVVKEWPVFGGISVTAARMAVAAGWQGRFAAVNDALFTLDLPLTQAKLDAAAKASGVDLARLAVDLVNRGHELDSMLGKIAMQAASLGLQGTPGLVIGPYLVPGALSYDDLLKLVTTVRSRVQPAQSTSRSAGKPQFE